jgi:amidase
MSQAAPLTQFGVTPAYNLAAKYDPRFNGEYQLDNATGIATLTGIGGGDCWHVGC